MSRIGNTPISLPKGVEVQGTHNHIEVKGPKGINMLDLPPGISLLVEQERVVVSVEPAGALKSSFHGLYRALIANAIIGVSQGFEKSLSLVGVGYRATVKDQFLDLQLGFSHPCQIAIPKDLSIEIEKSVLIKISGKNKQQVGQFAANVRAFRPPEPYNQKGIRYVGEYVRKKAGKARKGK